MAAMEAPGSQHWLSTAAVASVTPTGLVPLTRLLGPEFGSQRTHRFALLSLRAVAAKVREKLFLS